MRHIAIIGFGFSGNLLLANLLRAAQPPMTVYVIDPKLNGRGVAYGTPYDAHLLNVRAGNMGAFADDVGHFHAWLHRQGMPYAPTDFVPRKIYGAYLDSIWQDTQALAAEKKIFLKLVPSTAVAITKAGEALHVLTERGDAIAVEQAVLATGNEVKPMPGCTLQNPWAPGALAEAAKQPGPIALMGTGLTAVDVVLALRQEGYAGELVAFSRNGLLPQAHRDGVMAEALDAQDVAAQQSLQQWATWLRRKTRGGSDWRAVVDGLRPFTQSAWQKLTTPQQMLFFRRLASFWNVHRHRMAPQIAQQLAASGVRVLNRQGWKQQAQVPAVVINCTGPELDVRKSAQPLLKQLVASKMVEPHATGVGIAVDPQARAWGEAYPRLYAIGALMTGQLLESTAVPELRGQATQIAEALCK